MNAVPSIIAAVRYALAAVFVLSLVIALVYWAAREGKISAYGWIARMTRKLFDPIVRPLERRVVRWGGNPQDAPLWLIGIVMVLGILLLALIRWTAGAALHLAALTHAGPREWIESVIGVVYYVLMLALLVRVFGPWLGMGRYHRLARYAYRLTDWFVEPIRRAIPAFRFLDLSLLIALIAVWAAKIVLLNVLAVAFSSKLH